MADPDVVTIRPDQTVKEAFEAAAAGSERLAVVVDADGRVLGTLTAGWPACAGWPTSTRKPLPRLSAY